MAERVEPAISIPYACPSDITSPEFPLVVSTTRTEESEAMVDDSASEKSTKRSKLDPTVCVENELNEGVGDAVVGLAVVGDGDGDNVVGDGVGVAVVGDAVVGDAVVGDDVVGDGVGEDVAGEVVGASE